MCYVKKAFWCSGRVFEELMEDVGKRIRLLIYSIGPQARVCSKMTGVVIDIE